MAIAKARRPGFKVPAIVIVACVALVLAKALLILFLGEPVYAAALFELGTASPLDRGIATVMGFDAMTMAIVRLFG